MKYTKGDWTIQAIPHDFDFRTGKAYVIRDKRNCALAEVGAIDAIFDGTETENNARIIAQSPKMYEILKAIEAYHKDGIDRWEWIQTNVSATLKAIEANG